MTTGNAPEHATPARIGKSALRNDGNTTQPRLLASLSEDSYFTRRRARRARNTYEREHTSKGFLDERAGAWTGIFLCVVAFAALHTPAMMKPCGDRPTGSTVVRAGECSSNNATPDAWGRRGKSSGTGVRNIAATHASAPLAAYHTRGQLVSSSAAGGKECKEATTHDGEGGYRSRDGGRHASPATMGVSSRRAHEATSA